jgi:kinesin family member C1
MAREVRELKAQQLMMAQINNDKMAKLQQLNDDNMAKLQQLNDDKKVLQNRYLDSLGKIRVYVRVRSPVEAGRQLCDLKFVGETDLEVGNNTFNYTRVFNTRSKQSEVFEIVAPLIQSAMDGFNVSIFAYGKLKILLTQPPPPAIDVVFEQPLIFLSNSQVRLEVARLSPWRALKRTWE